MASATYYILLNTAIVDDKTLGKLSFDVLFLVIINLYDYCNQLRHYIYVYTL